MDQIRDSFHNASISDYGGCGNSSLQSLILHNVRIRFQLTFQKHNCKVFCSTLCNNLFKNGYPEIEFIPFGTTIDDIYAIYNVSMEEKDYNRNKTNWHLIPLQQAGSDFLGLDFKEIRPIIQVKKFKRAIKQKYVAIAEHSTFQCKYWNHPTGWQDLVKYLNSVGYQVMPITREKSYLKNVVQNYVRLD